MRKGKKRKIQRNLELLKQLLDSKVEAAFCFEEIKDFLLVLCREIELCLGPEEADQRERVEEIRENFNNEYIHNIEQIKSALSANINSLSDIVDRLPDVNLQVVFMPYTASMWDSFDSIYREIEKEESVELAVMPIPYRGIDAGNLFTEEFYEKDAFRGNLNLIDYRECPLDELSPDVIFIHNPYDEYNTLTRVYPQFFSSNLAKLTPRLVYIPYYLSDERTTSDQGLMPGVTNAWRVYVQSDEVRKQMIKMGNPSEKVVAIGSPKIDRILEQNEKREIPEAWKHKLKSKTVFCLVTTIVSVLNRPKIFLDKMQWICDYLQTRKDIAVIWRPHPHTHKLLKGANLETFNRLIKKFDELDNAVVDRESDNTICMSVCHAYIGERSSMLTLFKITGKPVYIFDWTKNSLGKGERPVSITAPACIGESWWAFESNYNAFFSVDFEKNKATYIGTLDGERKHGSLLVQNMISHDGKIIFNAGTASESWIYDTAIGDLKEMCSFRQSNEYGVKNVNIICEGDSIYFLPYFEEMIAVYSIENGTSKEISIDYDWVKRGVKKDSLFAWSMGEKSRDCFWLGSKMLGTLVCLEESGIIHEYETIEIKRGIEDGFIDEQVIYLLPVEAEDVIRFDITTKRFEKMNILNHIKKGYLTEVIKFWRYGSKWIFAQRGSLILYNQEDGSQNIWLTDSILFLRCAKRNDEVYFFSTNTEYYGKLDLISDRFGLYKIVLEEEEQTKMKDTFYNNVREVGTEDYFYSERITALDVFVDEVIEQNKRSEKEVRPQGRDKYLGYIDGSCGKRIWEDIKKTL